MTFAVIEKKKNLDYKKQQLYITESITHVCRLAVCLHLDLL